MISLLGADFLTDNDCVIEFYNRGLRAKEGELIFPLQSHTKNGTYFYNINALMCSVTGESSDVSDSGSEDDIPLKVRYTLPRDGIAELQLNDHAIVTLKRKICDRVPSSRWPEQLLKPYRRHVLSLLVRQDVVLHVKNERMVTVIPFLLLVEFVYKTHVQLAHIGRLKLVDIVSSHFWHPDVGKVCRDVCTSCTHCQLYKSASTPVSPPVIKIQARHPFDLLCIDLLQFERSSKGNVAILVAIDHFSKFLCAVPLRNKKAPTVVDALEGQVLSKMLKIPKRILSDNGPEVKAKEFGELVNCYGIEHVNSTKYRASGNGAVERSNRTITDFLKGLLQDDTRHWDGKLDRAVMLYNNSVHTELGCTPANFIMQNVHNYDDILPVSADVMRTWRAGHPKFAPFNVGQKVAYRIPRIGNRLADKLKRKYDGPFRVSKIQTNSVTYEVVAISEPNRCIKVHH